MGSLNDALIDQFEMITRPNKKQTGSLNMAAIYQVGGDHSALQTQLGSNNIASYKVIMETGLINIKEVI
jgi:hypothetical protein